jgi:hypothetical protein
LIHSILFHADGFIIVSGSKAADLTALGNVILRSSNGKYRQEHTSDYGYDPDHTLAGAALVALSLYECAMNAGDDSGAFSYANMLYRGQ